MPSSNSDAPIIITVAPVEGGWALRAPALCVDLFFLRGAQAEAAARALAVRLAAAHRIVEVDIRLRGGGLAGRRRYPSLVAA
jgi:hypothetical protein